MSQRQHGGRENPGARDPQKMTRTLFGLSSIVVIHAILPINEIGCVYTGFPIASARVSERFAPVTRHACLNRGDTVGGLPYRMISKPDNLLTVETVSVTVVIETVRSK